MTGLDNDIPKNIEAVYLSSDKKIDLIISGQYSTGKYTDSR